MANGGTHHPQKPLVSLITVPSQISLRNHPTATILTGIVARFLAGIGSSPSLQNQLQATY